MLKPNSRISIQTLLQVGKAQREIARVTGEERWAAPRIHGRKKRQVLTMFGGLPLTGFAETDEHPRRKGIVVISPPTP